MTAISYEQTLKQQYAAARARLLSSRPKPKLVTVEAPKAVAPTRPVNHLVTYRPPEWETHPHEHDWHVVEWRIWKFKNLDTPMKHLRQRCAEIGYSVERITGPEREKRLVEARHTLMHEIKMKFDISFPQLGRLFGNRDHTSALWGVKKIEASLRGEKLTKSHGRLVAKPIQEAKEA